jgi:hypothetical protein
MSKIRFLFILLAGIALTLTAASHESHSVVNQNPIHHHDDVDINHPCEQHSDIHHGEHDHAAIAEMALFAAHHYNGATQHPGTFGAATEWSHDWELRWVDYDVSGHTVRLYHLTNKHDAGIRYLSASDHEHGHYGDWQPAH